MYVFVVPEFSRFYLIAIGLAGINDDRIIVDKETFLENIVFYSKCCSTSAKRM